MKLQPGQRLELVEKEGKIEIRPILTTDQLVGFLKEHADVPFKREKQDRRIA